MAQMACLLRVFTGRPVGVTEPVLAMGRLLKQ
jgi:hypothetical protein